MGPAGERRQSAAGSLVLHGLVIALAAGCGMDLTDSLDGRPCGDGNRCLTGYTCREKRCVRAPGSGGSAGLNAAAVPATGGTAVSAGGGGAASGGRDGELDAGAGGARDADADAPPPDREAGAPDASLDVDAGAGGAPATGGAPGTGGAAGASGNVQCNGVTCSGGDACCLSDFPGFPDFPDPADFSCSQGLSSCEYALLCDGDHDCANGEVCCATRSSGNWVAECATSCTASEQVHLGCTAPDHCSTGLRCCGDWSSGSSRFLEVRCVATTTACNLPDAIFCDTSADCTPNQPTCTAASTVPGFTRCQ